MKHWVKVIPYRGSWAVVGRAGVQYRVFSNKEKAQACADGVRLGFNMLSCATPEIAKAVGMLMYRESLVAA